MCVPGLWIININSEDEQSFNHEALMRERERERESSYLCRDGNIGKSTASSVDAYTYNY